MASIEQGDRFIEHRNHWTIPLQGKIVTRCFLDSAFGIELSDRDYDITIRIEGTFRLKVLDKEYKLSPENPTALGPALSLFQKEVYSSSAYKDGKLEVAFLDENCLLVEPDTEYEAWEIVGSSGLKVVCMPGGQLSVWQSILNDATN